MRVKLFVYMLTISLLAVKAAGAVDFEKIREVFLPYSVHDMARDEKTGEVWTYCASEHCLHNNDVKVEVESNGESRCLYGFDIDINGRLACISDRGELTWFDPTQKSQSGFIRPVIAKANQTAFDIKIVSSRIFVLEPRFLDVFDLQGFKVGMTDLTKQRLLPHFHGNDANACIAVTEENGLYNIYVVKIHGFCMRLFGRDRKQMLIADYQLSDFDNEGSYPARCAVIGGRYLAVALINQNSKLEIYDIRSLREDSRAKPIRIIKKGFLPYAILVESDGNFTVAWNDDKFQSCRMITYQMK